MMCGFRGMIIGYDTVVAIVHLHLHLHLHLHSKPGVLDSGKVHISCVHYYHTIRLSKQNFKGYQYT